MMKKEDERETDSRTPVRTKNRLMVLKESYSTPIPSKSPALRIPPSPSLKRLGFGTGVNVLLYERSPKGKQVLSPWAIKKVNKRHAKGDIGQRLEVEAKILKTLNHPNIIGYRGYQRNSDGTQFLAIENGETSLYDLLEQRKENDEELVPLKPNRILKIVTAICRALHYLHSEALRLHGDIKSGNVLIAGEDVENVKLCDFGVSLKLNSQGKVLPGQQYVGTEAWSAKEVIDEVEPITIKADIFALGCTIYEMLALQAPHIDKLPEFDEDDDEGEDDVDDDDEENFDDSEYQEALGTRPELPEWMDYNEEYNTVLSIFYACTDIDPIKRPTADKILEVIENSAKKIK